MNATEIRALRQRLGLSQMAFAVRLGITPETVSRWENGHCIPRGLAIKALRELDAETTPNEK
jgi:DNA-binding transcriptional regulator YiaG